MKKTIIAFVLFLLACTYTTYAQKVPVSINGSYRTDFREYGNIRDWGIGAQTIIPIYKSLHIAPNISYFFESETKYLFTIEKHKSLNYGIDVHYVFNLANNKISTSPFVGVEGATYWFNSNKTISPKFDELFPSIGKSISDMNNKAKTHAFGNIGVSARYLINDDIFLNSQIKFSALFEDLESNLFTFSMGIGYLF